MHEIAIAEARTNRGAFRRQLAEAERVYSREAYLESTGAPNGARSAKAEVERLKAALDHIEAIEAGAIQADEASRQAALVAHRKARHAAAGRARRSMIGAARELDGLIDKVAEAWDRLCEGHGEHGSAAIDLAQGGHERDMTHQAVGHFKELVATRIAALLGKKGLLLPDGREVIHTAERRGGRDGNNILGLLTVAELVDQRCETVQTRTHAPEFKEASAGAGAG